MNGRIAIKEKVFQTYGARAIIKGRSVQLFWMQPNLLRLLLLLPQQVVRDLLQQGLLLLLTNMTN